MIKLQPTLTCQLYDILSIWFRKIYELFSTVNLRDYHAYRPGIYLKIVDSTRCSLLTRFLALRRWIRLCWTVKPSIMHLKYLHDNCLFIRISLVLLIFRGKNGWFREIYDLEVELLPLSWEINQNVLRFEIPVNYKAFM